MPSSVMSCIALLCAFVYGGAAQDLFLFSSLSSSKESVKPNFVYFLTDDQDQLLGGSFPVAAGQPTPMPKTKALMQDAGAYGSNFYIHTPICSPSRAELLTGRYFHNVKQVGGDLWGMHLNHSIVETKSFVQVLKEEGYTTGLFGKYLNQMPTSPPGSWDAWLANGGGDYIGPSFQTKNIDGYPDGNVKFSNAPANYTTAVVGNLSIAWIRKVATARKPFLAYISPKAAHEPFNPALWYRDAWDPAWPEREPRPVNWNCTAEARSGHHGNIPTAPLLTDKAGKMITGIFKNRWRTLMSVDDLIADVIQAVEKLGLSDSTYFFYSSDHGFQLGQFNIPMDKRHVYEWDTKIHLLARGPGIKPGSSFPQPATQVDMAPTILGLAGLRIPETMDGKSLAPLLLDPSSSELLPCTKAHLQELGDTSAYQARWRSEIFIEYYFVDFNLKCLAPCGDDWSLTTHDYPTMDSNCGNLVDNTDCWCNGKPSEQVNATCYPTESPSNNFIALRELGNNRNTLYAQFQTGDQRKYQVSFKESEVDFLEYYELDKDPWQIHNAIRSLPWAARISKDQRLQQWLGCVGASCP